MMMSAELNLVLEEEKTFELKTEKRALRTIDHPFIIKIIDEFEIEGYQCQVIDLANKCSL
jgi:hypothetical protein